ncbi:hypothetical protein, partial [Mesorhizobium japonicum]|uniref:hypothetical protein n=1 Tax=Mesorhizobium japonicum TaxID=2066070 RepID=UPI003B59E3ED
DWSWSLLDEGERSMLAALAIYPAGIAASDAAEAAAAHGGTRAQLDALVDKSLLQRANGRYRALETIREYGIERLAERGDLVAQRRAQACRLAAATAVYDARLRSSDIHAAIAWFDAEDDNLAAALRFCADAPHPETLVDITGGCLWYWIVRDRNEDALTWSAAAAPHADGDRWQAVLLRAAGYMMRAFGGSERGRMPDLDTRELGELSAAAGRTEHDIVLTIPVIVEAVADAGPSENWMNLARFPDPDSRRLTPWGRGIVLVARAALAQNRGELADLGDSSRRAVELFRGIGDGWGLSIAQQMRAEWLMLEGRFEEALAMADSSTDAMSRITSSWDLLQQQGLAVTLLMRLGRPTEARERIERILARARESDSARAVTLADTMACSLAVEFEDAAWGRALIDEMDERLAEWDDVPPQLRALAGTARGGVAALD